MKILLIPSTMLPFPPIKGGAVQNLIKNYIDWNDENSKHEITILSYYDVKAKRESLGWNHCSIKYFRIPKILFSFRKSNTVIISKLGFRLIHILYFIRIKFFTVIHKDFDLIVLENTPQLIKAIHNKDNKSKIYIHVYNDYLNCYTKDIQFILKNAQKIITVSDYISSRVINTGFIESYKVRTLYNSIDLSKFDTFETRQAGEQLRKQYGISQEATVFIFVARIVKEKGIKELLEAFVSLDSVCSHLVIVGNKLYGENVTDSFLLELKHIAEKKPFQIHFTGYIDYGILPNYYSMADVGVLPSLYEEPFALSAIEYMASGLAVILSDAGGFPEMARNDSAIIVNRGGKMVNDLCTEMKSLIMNKERLAYYKEKGKERSVQFDAESYCKKLNETYEQQY